MYMGRYSLDGVDLSPKTRVCCICIRAVTHLMGWILALRPEYIVYVCILAVTYLTGSILALRPEYIVYVYGQLLT